MTFMTQNPFSNWKMHTAVGRKKIFVVLKAFLDAVKHLWDVHSFFIYKPMDFSVKLIAKR